MQRSIFIPFNWRGASPCNKHIVPAIHHFNKNIGTRGVRSIGVKNGNKAPASIQTVFITHRYLFNFS